MLFNTIQYFAFLAIVAALFYLGPRSCRRIFLLAASYFFYMCWNPVFILLVLTALRLGPGHSGRFGSIGEDILNF